jgi:hypothetical protein
MYRLKIFVEALLKYTVLWKYSIRWTYRVRELKIQYHTALFPLRNVFKYSYLASGADVEAFLLEGQFILQ